MFTISRLAPLNLLESLGGSQQKSSFKWALLLPSCKVPAVRALCRLLVVVVGALSFAFADNECTNLNSGYQVLERFTDSSGVVHQTKCLDPVTAKIILPWMENIRSSTIEGVVYADQYPSVQAAINALPSSGGRVYLSCGTSQPGPTNIPSGVYLEALCLGASAFFGQPYTATLTYTNDLTIGPATGIGIKYINLSFSGSGALILNGLQQSHIMMSVTCAGGNPCVTMTSTSGANRADNAFNHYDYLNITTGGAIGLSINGASGSFVTLNHFGDVAINMNSTSGSITEAMGFTQNCDSNTFDSIHLFFTNVSSGNGIVFNDGVTPTVDTDADVEVIRLLDFTSGPAISGTAITVNRSSGIQWGEGFGITVFSTPLSVDANTNFTRNQLIGAGLMLGQRGIISPPGNPVSYYTIP